MDFAIVDDALRIKTKTATLFVNPLDGKKTEADAALYSSLKDSFSDARLNITGPGEYEVGGVKISAQRIGEYLYFLIEGDGLKVGVGKMTQIVNNQDKIPSSHVSIVDLNSPINLGSIISAEPSVIILYGEYSKDVKEAQSMNKYSVTFEKLPQETQTIVIG